MSVRPSPGSLSPAFVPRLAAILLPVLVFGRPLRATPAENAADARATEERLYEAVKFLASDELEGRGVGTKGLDQAADFVAVQFADAGLNTAVADGGPFQKFSMVVATEQGEPNRLALVRPATAGENDVQTVELKLGVDFNPLAIGGSGRFDLPLVFAGYGITAKDDKYDDYAGIDVEGKAVLVLRHEPQQDNPHSAFNGTDPSLHAYFTRKVSNAYQHGAAAVVFCNDDFDLKKNVDQRTKRWQAAVDELSKSQAKFNEINNPTPEQVEAQRQEIAKLVKEVSSQSEKLFGEYDPLLGFLGAQGDEAHRIPVVFCRRAAIEPIVKSALGKTLAELEGQIDAQPAPASAELPGWRVQGEITVNRREAEVKNVVGVLQGEGPHADETIVVGAHYDHLGLGGEGSLAAGVKEIHNGADDNASGTAALIEVARRLASRAERLPRRVVFVAFTGEERGLIGSARYCRDPLVPLDKTVAMLNMDMVGRLMDDKLVIQGVDTASEFGPLIDRLAGRFGFQVTKQPGGFGPSDHSSFYPHEIPVMHFFTGTHSDYHRPSDDYEKINLPGMRRVAEMVADAVAELAEASERPHYQAAKAAKRGPGRGGDRPYFGSIPDFASDEPGYHLGGVSPDSPADKGGLQKGDAVVKLGEFKIGNLEDFDGALRKFKAGDKVPVVVRRDGKELTLEVILDPPR